MEWTRRALLWFCITAISLPCVINEPLMSLWTASMKPGSLVGDIKTILMTQLKNRLTGGMMSSGPGGYGNTAGGSGGMMSSLLGGLAGSSAMGGLLGGPQGYGSAGGSMNNMDGTSYSAPGARFDDYMRGGLKMHATIAIDFSISNGPDSLHYLNPQGLLNGYEEALASVVGVVEAYDWDKKFQVYGFGAQFPSQNPVSHAFNLNPDFSECIGVQGVLDAYRRSLPGMVFSRPTLFSPIISQVTQNMRPGDQDNYYLLLILTAGQIEDMAQTEQIIAQASVFPLSIMIVGIGRGPFDYMVKLDNDVVGILKMGRKQQKQQSGYYNGKPKKEKKKNKMGLMGTMGAMGAMGGMDAMGGMSGMGPPGVTSGAGPGGMMVDPMNRRKHRDIVQFVPFNMFQRFGVDNVARVQFGQKLLEELPYQVESYMRSNNFMPRPPNLNQPMPDQNMYSSGIAGGTTNLNAYPSGMPGGVANQSMYPSGAAAGPYSSGIAGGMPGHQSTSVYGQPQQPAGGYGATSNYQQSPQTNLYSGNTMQSPYPSQPMGQQSSYLSQPNYYQGTAGNVPQPNAFHGAPQSGVGGGSLAQFGTPNTAYSQGQGNPYGGTFQSQGYPLQQNPTQQGGLPPNSMHQSYPPHNPQY